MERSIKMKGVKMKKVINKMEAVLLYNNWLNKQYKPYKIGYHKIPASFVLQKCKPDLYWTGFRDFLEDGNLEIE